MGDKRLGELVLVGSAVSQRIMNNAQHNLAS